MTPACCTLLPAQQVDLFLMDATSTGWLEFWPLAAKDPSGLSLGALMEALTSPIGDLICFLDASPLSFEPPHASLSSLSKSKVTKDIQ